MSASSSFRVSAGSGNAASAARKLATHFRSRAPSRIFQRSISSWTDLDFNSPLPAACFASVLQSPVPGGYASKLNGPRHDSSNSNSA